MRKKAKFHFEERAHLLSAPADPHAGKDFPVVIIDLRQANSHKQYYVKSVNRLKTSTFLFRHFWIQFSPFLHCRICIKVCIVTAVIFPNLKITTAQEFLTSCFFFSPQVP